MASSTNTAQQFWDSFSQGYSLVEPINYQAGFSLFILAKGNAPGARVLDVGCGSGFGATIVANSTLSRQESPVYIIADFSN